MTYEWDPVKAAANVKKHGVTFEEAASVLFVAHAAREGRVRIISARRATRQEQKQYEEGIGEAT